MGPEQAAPRPRLACPSCHSTVGPGDHWCPVCGATPPPGASWVVVEDLPASATGATTTADRRRRARLLVVGIGSVAVVLVAGLLIHATATSKPKAQTITISGDVSFYYQGTCWPDGTVGIHVTDASGHQVGRSATLTRDPATDKSTCVYNYVLDDVPELGRYRLVTDGVHGAIPFTGAELEAAGSHLNTWVTKGTDLDAIHALQQQIDSAEHDGVVAGLNLLSTDGWPFSTWTAQKMICPKPGQTLQQALRPMIPPGARLQDRLLVGELLPSPGWTPSWGPGAGRHPPGHVYVLWDDVSQSNGQAGGSLTHVVVLPGGVAAIFPLACGSTLHHLG